MFNRWCALLRQRPERAETRSGSVERSEVSSVEPATGGEFPLDLGRQFLARPLGIASARPISFVVGKEAGDAETLDVSTC